MKAASRRDSDVVAGQLKLRPSAGQRLVEFIQSVEIGHDAKAKSNGINRRVMLLSAVTISAFAGTANSGQRRRRTGAASTDT
jgi:hypothetical protein